jgi:hypothetical protein
VMDAIDILVNKCGPTIFHLKHKIMLSECNYIVHIFWRFP